MIKKQIDYLVKLTDKTGIIEHCLGSVPDYNEGYCVDDNARALHVCLKFQKKYPILKSVFIIYFNFLKSAVKDDFFYNDLDQDLSWKKSRIKGEHFGRTLAALGEIIKSKNRFSLEAEKLFDQIYLSFDEKKSPYIRVSSQIILGLKNYNSKDVEIWANSLIDEYLKEKTNSWKWFEPMFSYDIGRLPLALLSAYQSTNNSKYLQIAIESLDFLTELTFNKKMDCFVFPGNKGWFTKSGSRNFFDQQPLEAGSCTEAYSLACQITKNKKYRDLALKSFAWYSGKNIIKANMIDPITGGIYDGFSSEEVNKNQGAESILSYLLAYEAIEKLKKQTE